MTDKNEQIMDILMNYLPKEGVSKTRDRLVELFAPQGVDANDVLLSYFSWASGLTKEEINRQRNEPENKFDEFLEEYKPQPQNVSGDYYDTVKLGTFIGDLDRFNKEIETKVRTAREDAYWAIIKREVAESGNEPKGLIKEKGQEGYTDWLKGFMKHASFTEVGLHKILARADVTAKKELYEIETRPTKDSREVKE